MQKLTAATVILFATCVGFVGMAVLMPPSSKVSELPVNHPEYQTTYVEPYTYGGSEPSLDSLQCPIPMEDRVPNYTGIQCVYSSTEMLGRWAEEPKLVEPPITSRSDCKGYSGPSRLSSILRKLEVRFEQSNGSRSKGLQLIKKAMDEGRGCLFGVPGHAMVLVHYDESNDRVCWVDNSDRSLKVQTMSVSRFKQRWDSWICIIYADNDVIPYKLGRGPNLIPIRDWENGEELDPRDWITLPSRKAA